ncbi:hypothetical protein WD019_02525 [Fictibacillus sp. Mic-4]|uniref:phage tail assembly chaperone n=1 Tax=Fictibacillus sp. Mic-4 TaxID=3132826 RepID=UPI003CEBB408
MANLQKDPLAALLSADLDVREQVPIKRLGINLEVKSLDTPTLKRLTERATFGGEVDELKLNALLIDAACVLDFGNEKLLEKYGASDPADCVQKALLPGEINKLVTSIMQVSGFDDFNTQVKQAKN